MGRGSPSCIAATVDATEIARLLKYNERWLRSEDAVVVFEVNENELTMTFTLRSVAHCDACAAIDVWEQCARHAVLRFACAGHDFEER